MSKKKHTFTEIEYDNELSFYYFKELDENGKLVDTYENLNKNELTEYRDSLVQKSSGKPKSKRNQRKEEVDDIDKMVDGLIQTFDNNKPEDAERGSNDLPERTSNVPAFNFRENRTKSEKQAAHLLKSVLKFYLSEEYIAENEYIKAKVGIDQLTLSGLINQIKLSESAIERLMESIDSGEVHPRMFEVLAGMQRVYIDLMKHQTLSVIAVEEHMKKLKDDFDYYQSKPISEGSKSSNETTDINEDNIQRGTRDLLKAMEDEEDIDYEEEDDNNSNTEE